MGKTWGKMNNHSLAVSMMMRNSSLHTNSRVLGINTSFIPHTETKSTEKSLNGEEALKQNPHVHIQKWSEK